MYDKFRDECGVFGIFGHPEAANLTYLGLYALQHRGQESAGIVSADGERMLTAKSMGHVAEAFDEPTLAGLPGHLAIGHTRYSTAGESRLQNAQPFLIDCAHGQIAVAHNGNLVNARELRDELVRAGSIFQTSSDTEVVLHLYARSKAPSVEEALVESVAQLSGAFSLVMLTKNRLIAARDPHGFRPLALGRLGDAWIVCSETCALDLIGATYVRDVEPGEMSSSATAACDRSARSRRRRSRTACSSTCTSPGPTATSSASVNDIRTELGRVLARESPADADVVVPIPDSGVCAAVGFAEASAVRCRSASFATITSGARSSSRSSPSATSASR
jgi:amidophosphoribosyltransferase